MLTWRQRITIPALVFFLATMLFFSGGGLCQEKKAEADSSLISLDFYDVDINVLIKFMSDLTGRNFVVDPAVKGNVNVISPSRLTKEEAYRVFQSVLEVYGFTTIDSGNNITKIIPLQKAKEQGVQIVAPGARETASPGDKMITRIIALRYADASELEASFAPLISKSSVIMSHPATNTLVITDVASNIERLVRIIREIDVPGYAKKITVIHLEYANAKDLAKQLTDLLEEEITRSARRNPRIPAAQGQTEKQSKIIPQERTNTLVILATQDDTQKIKDLIAKLDQPTPSGRDFIHVYYLKNAVAEEVAKVLSEIKAEKQGEKGAASGATTKPAISETAVIVADKATNSLVIRAMPEEYEIVSKIIDKLDIPRAMVYVEGLIVEVTTDKAMKLGVEWNVGKSFSGGDSVAFTGSNAGSTGALSALTGAIQTQDSVIAFPAGFALGVLGENITLGNVTFPTISALINAVANDTDFNILSTPQLLTTDNVEAEVKVAQNLPFLTRVDQGTDVTSRAIQTFEYRDVGVTLKVTPQINRDRFVRLQIEEEVKNVITAQTQSGTGEVLLTPTTNVRSAKTTVIVKDAETVVLGGLVQDTRQGSNVRVPCLGELPLVGAFFRSTSESKGKTNLLVFLTPHIVENTEEARQLYLQRRAEMEKTQEQQKTLQGKPQGNPQPAPSGGGK